MSSPGFWFESLDLERLKTQDLESNRPMYKSFWKKKKYWFIQTQNDSPYKLAWACGWLQGHHGTSEPICQSHCSVMMGNSQIWIFYDAHSQCLASPTLSRSPDPHLQLAKDNTERKNKIKVVINWVSTIAPYFQVLYIYALDPKYFVTPHRFN